MDEALNFAQFRAIIEAAIAGAQAHDVEREQALRDAHARIAELEAQVAGAKVVFVAPTADLVRVVSDAAPGVTFQLTPGAIYRTTSPIELKAGQVLNFNRATLRTTAHTAIEPIAGASGWAVRDGRFESSGAIVIRPTGDGGIIAGNEVVRAGDFVNCNRRGITRLTISDNKSPDPRGLAGYFAWIEGVRGLTIVQNRVANSLAQHVLRFGPDSAEVEIKGNWFANIRDAMPGDVDKGCVSINQGVHFVISDNVIIGGGTGGGIGIGDAKFGAAVDVVVANNVLWQAPIVIANDESRQVAVSGNQISLADVSPVQVRGGADIVIEGNTIANPGVWQACIEIVRGASIRMRGNRLSAPKLVPLDDGKAAIVVRCDPAAIVESSGNRAWLAKRSMFACRPMPGGANVAYSVDQWRAMGFDDAWGEGEAPVVVEPVA